jgi:MFS family permease
VAVLALLFGGAALGVAWWLTERAARVPLIQVSYLTRRDVGVPYAITFLIAFGIYGSLSAATRLAQTPASSGYGWGWSTLAVGWFALPQIIAALLAIVALRAARRHGLPPVTAVALAIIVIGFAAYAFGHGTHALFLTGTGLEGCGLAIAIASTQLLVVRAVPAEESGIALGLSVVMYAVGNSVGSSVFGVLFASMTNHAGKPTLAAFTTGFVICGACALAALGLCAPLLRPHAVAAAPERAASVAE